MGKPAFTPGPWPAPRLSAEGNWMIGSMPAIAGARLKPDADLIWAAPRLYEALNDALELAADLEQAGRVFSPEQLSELRRFEAVLAEARGEAKP